MSSTGLITLKEIQTMLDDCAPGAVIVAKLHRNWVQWSGKTFRNLPLGPHGSRKDPEVKRGHVKSMARFFGIQDCAKRYLS